MKISTFFLIPFIIAIFAGTVLSNKDAFAYSSPDIPVHHWSYEAVEKLAIAGLLGLAGTCTKPMTRIQMAYKVKEAMDNVEEERLPPHLCFDREHIEYLQTILYKLINEFRQDLVLIGASVAEIRSKDEESLLDKSISYNLVYPLKVEHRYTKIKSRKDDLLENENGLRLEEGYNLRTRAYPWLNLFNTFTFSATPAFRLTESDSELYLDEAAVKISLFNLEASAQKSAMWWGPGFHGSMLMSNNAKPLNLIRVRSVNPFNLPWVFKNLGSFGINFFISRLEKDRTIEEPSLAGLRLEWSPLPYLSLGASRTAIMGGRGRPKPSFKDYVKIFFARSKDEFTTGNEAKRTDTDQLASLDVRFVMSLGPEFRPASGIEIYGEWAGEDRFSFWENESPGLLMGLFLTDVLRDKGTDFRIEYAKNKPAWYNHGLYNASGTATAYTYKGEVMGHHMGGDADDLFLRISKELAFLSTPFFNSVKAGGQLDIERHGLSGAAQEKLIEVAGDVLWFHADSVTFSLGYELENYKNFNFVSGRTAKNHIFLAELNLRF